MFQRLCFGRSRDFVKQNLAEKEKEIQKKQKLMKEVFASADKLHLTSNGEKWTREEMNER